MWKGEQRETQRNTEPEANSLGSILDFVSQSHLTMLNLLGTHFSWLFSLICNVAYVVNDKAIAFGREKEVYGT